MSELSANQNTFFFKISQFFNIFFFLKEKIEQWIIHKEKLIVCRNMLEEANSYEEWKSLAKQLDILEGKHEWKRQKESSIYDWKEVDRIIELLQKKREMKDIKGIVHFLRTSLVKNLLNTNNNRLYYHTNYGTKYAIENLKKEILKSLEFIATFNDKTLSLEKKIEFFSETRHSYGRTALLLSGGGFMALYHAGVLKALHDNNLLPKIICGTSAGSVIAAVVCTRFPEEFNSLMLENKISLGPFKPKHSNYSFFRKIYRFLTRGVLMDVEVLKDFIRENVDDYTFQEAFDKTGWILNIGVTGYKEHENNRILNYITAPNVLIWSACLASSCIPGIFDPVELLCKNEYGHIVPYNKGKSKFIDGSIENDIPMKRISELFNVNTFIVSQTNPHIIPFMNEEKTSRSKFSFFRIFKTLVWSEIKHRFTQLQQLGLFSNNISKYFSIFTQEYQGDITILPVPRTVDYLKILSNPTQDDIDRCKIMGARRTFPKLEMIKGYLDIENALSNHLKKLKNRIINYNIHYEKVYESETNDHNSRKSAFARGNSLTNLQPSNRIIEQEEEDAGATTDEWFGEFIENQQKLLSTEFVLNTKFKAKGNKAKRFSLDYTSDERYTMFDHRKKSLPGQVIRTKSLGLNNTSFNLSKRERNDSFNLPRTVENFKSDVMP